MERELNQILHAWNNGVEKWRENHESIPAAFIELARVMDSLANFPVVAPPDSGTKNL